MTTIVGGSKGGTNMYGSDQLLGLAASTLGTHNSTQFTLANSDFSLTGFGSGLGYSGNHPSSGTLTSLSITESNQMSSSWSGFSISVPTLWQAISTGNITTFNSLFFAGNDTFTSGSNDINSVDRFAGYGGDDVFNMGSHFNYFTSIDGGDGNDTLNLDGDYSQARALFGSNASNIEKIVLAGGHSYNFYTQDNTLVAAGQTLTIDGSALLAGNVLRFIGAGELDGAFNLIGGAGNDYMRGGSGNDTFNGGAGIDTVDYADGQALTIDLNLTTPQAVGYFGSDTLLNIENIIGSRYDDHLVGNASNNTFRPGVGDDYVDGGAGSDTIDYSDGSFVYVDLNITGPQNVGSGSGTDTLISIENVIGTDSSDTFIGTPGDNIFDGGFGIDTVRFGAIVGGIVFDYSGNGAGPVVTGAGIGHDTYISIERFYGSDGDDTVIAGTGDLTFDGGAGFDTVDFSHWTTGVSYASGSVFAASVQNYFSIEKVIGTSFNDSIGGAPAVNAEIHGGDGDDNLYGGGAVTNLVFGDAGDDVITAAHLDTGDYADGGTGLDTIKVGGSVSGTEVFSNHSFVNFETFLMSAGSYTDYKFDDSNVAAGQTLTVKYETVPPSYYYMQPGWIDGSAETNGSFNITTLWGTDRLVGGAGNDTFNAGGANDVIIGGGGIDTAVYSGLRSDYAITVNPDYSLTIKDLRTDSPDGTDTLTQVEYAKFSDGTVSIVVTNTVPVLAGAANTVNYTEQAAGVAVAPGLVVTDDGANLLGATVTITGGSVVGDQLSFTGQAGIGGGYNSTTHVLTLSGAASIADYQAVLRSITFSSLSDDPTAGGSTSRTVAFSVFDGQLTSAPVTSTVNLTAVDDAPSLATLNVAFYVEQGTPVALTPGALVSDVDSANLASLTVTISDGFSVGDQLNFTAQNGISGNWNAATHALTLSGAASAAAYQAALRSVTFSSTNHNPPTTELTISYTASDGTASSAPVTSFVSITPIDDLPTLAGAPAAVSYTEQAPGVAIAPGLSVTDADTPSLTGAVIYISNGFSIGDVLNFTAQGGVTGSFDLDGGALVLSGAASLATYQAVLRSVTFSSTSDTPTAAGATRSIVLLVRDGDTFSAPLGVTVNVTDVNDAPTLAGAGNTAGYTEQASPLVLDGALTIADVDSATLAGAAVTVASGFVAGDTLNFVGQNGITGSYNAATHILTLTGAASVANYQAALRSVTFFSASDNPDNYGASTSRTITWKVDDGQAANHASNTGSTTLNVTAVDDPASLHNDAFQMGEQYGIGDGLSVFANNGSGADSDPDSILHVTAVNGVTANVGTQITLASGALLTVNADGTFAYDPGGAFAGLAAPGSGSSDTAATDSFTYTANGATATVTLTIAGVDSNDTLHGTAANDSFDGGIGTDTLVFTGNRADYAVSYSDIFQYYTVTDLRGGHPDGTDIVKNVENFRFADGTFSYATFVTHVHNGDGTDTTNIYDAGGDHPWASQVVVTDTAGSMSSQSYTGDGGTIWINSFDTAGNASWLWKTANYDSANHLLSEYGTNDDGTHWLTLNDVANAYRWATATVSFDSSGNITGVTGTNDDATHTVTMKDIAAAYDSAAWFVTPYDGNLNGAPVDTVLTGGGNADYLQGFAGNDTLSGQGGNDLLAGGAGNDALTGGSGDDRFVFHNGDGLDTITDFIAGNAGGDVIELHAYGIASFTALQPLMTQSGADVVIAFDPDNTITLQHVTLAQLNAGDFAFG